MADLVVDGEDLLLHLPPAQKFFSFHGDIRIPLTAIRSVTPVEKPWLALRGRRMAGTALRGVAAMGTWTHADRRYDFNIVRKQLLAVQIDVNSGRFDRYIICRPEGTDITAEARELARAAGIAP